MIMDATTLYYVESIFPLKDLIGPFEFKVEGRSKTAGTAEGCDFWDQNGVLLLHLRVQQQRKSKINELTMSDGIE